MSSRKPTKDQHQQVKSSGRWLSVSMIKPRCSRDENALGTPVLIWPRAGAFNTITAQCAGVDGFAYYGRRATGSPAFYLFGAEIPGVTHWQPMPKGPRS